MTSPANTSYTNTYGCSLAYRHNPNSLVPQHNLYDNSEWIVTFAETAYKIDLIKTIRDWAKACGGDGSLLEAKQTAEGTRTLIVTSVYALALLSMKINETNSMIVERQSSGVGGNIGDILSIDTMVPVSSNMVLRV